MISKPPPDTRTAFTPMSSIRAPAISNPGGPDANLIAVRDVKTWPASGLGVSSCKIVCSSGLLAPNNKPASADEKATPNCVVKNPQKAIAEAVVNKPP